MSRSITTREKARSLAAVTIRAFESCLRASTSLQSLILRQARSTRNCCSMVRGITDDDTSKMALISPINLARTTPQPWKLRPKKNEKIARVLEKLANQDKGHGEIVVFQQGMLCSLEHPKTGLRSLRRSDQDHQRHPKATARS